MIESGLEIARFTGHAKLIWSVAFSPDGRFALSGSGDKTLRLWELDRKLEQNPPADWSEEARHHLATFQSLHTPYASMLPDNRQPTEAEIAQALTRRGEPNWTEEDFRHLLDTLSCAGYGWLRPAGVRRH